MGVLHQSSLNVGGSGSTLQWASGSGMAESVATYFNAFLNFGLTEPVLQRRFADSEVGGDLLDGDAALATPGDRDDIFAELSGIGTGHDDILPANASRH